MLTAFDSAVPFPGGRQWWAVEEWVLSDSRQRQASARREAGSRECLHWVLLAACIRFSSHYSRGAHLRAGTTNKCSCHYHGEVSWSECPEWPVQQVKTKKKKKVAVLVLLLRQWTVHEKGRRRRHSRRRPRRRSDEEEEEAKKRWAKRRALWLPLQAAPANSNHTTSVSVAPTFADADIRKDTTTSSSLSLFSIIIVGARSQLIADSGVAMSSGIHPVSWFSPLSSMTVHPHPIAGVFSPHLEECRRRRVRTCK